jgi:hypothetical protein
MADGPFLRKSARTDGRISELKKGESMQLGKILRMWRRMNDVSIRAQATAIGISPATLSRIERGENMDGKSLAAVLMYLMSPADLESES